MKFTINDYEVGDHVEVYAYDDDDFYDFAGIIVDIDHDADLIVVRDQDDDCFSVGVEQIKFIQD